MTTEDNLVPLQNLCWCDDCQADMPTALVVTDDNRDHFVCLACGNGYVHIYGDEDDTGSHIHEYVFFNIHGTTGTYPVCELLH